MNKLSYVLSINPSDKAAQNKVLDMMKAKEKSIPPTPGQLTAQGAVLSSMISAGADGDKVMDRLEGLTQTADANNAIDPTLGGLIFNCISGLTPGQDGGQGGATGQSLMMEKYRTPNANFDYKDIVNLNDEMKAALRLFRYGATRKQQNHPFPTWDNPGIIDTCDSAFCDRPGLACIPKNEANGGVRIRLTQGGNSLFYTCCDAKNGQTICNDPPCWFFGNQCPASQHGSPTNPGLSGKRRLNETERSAQARALEHQKMKAYHGYMEHDQSDWFKSFKEYNFPLKNMSERQISDWDRAGSYMGWHPNIHERRLQYATVDSTGSDAARLMAMENDEKPMVEKAKALEKEAHVKLRDESFADSKQQLSYKSMTPKLAAKLEAAAQNEYDDKKAYNFQYARNQSQRITRLNVMRDTVAKALIRRSNPREIMVFKSKSFTLSLGKTTNLSSVHSAFVFPKAFQVPAGSPDYPTASNPVTGFSFVYVEYVKNIYDWSNSNPHSPENKLVSLLVFRASTLELDMETSAEPIQVFADLNLFSNTVCLYWDRFARGTAGGKWSSKGVTNDGQGCLTTHLSDFGIFVDGREFQPSPLIERATYFQRNIEESTCVGCGDASNMFIVAVLGMTLFTTFLLILMSYVLDESRRTDLMKNKQTSRYYIDGDGLTTPTSVDDPIAYSLSESMLWKFILGTLWNVMTRDHAILSCAYYHETFTRPQRLQCFIAVLTGLMAINAAIHSHPGYMQQANEYIISGVLSGLLVFPIFCGLTMMFNLRPAQVKKRLIKRAYSTREIDRINQERLRRIAQSSLLPPPGYTAIPPPPLGSQQGDTTILSLPAPLPLPPLPTGMVGTSAHLALPAPPGPGSTIPGMTGRLPLPPPPKFPPPPKNAKVPGPPGVLMPPLSWPKTGNPPPAPFPALHDASGTGTLQLPMIGGRSPMGTIASTGGTDDMGALPGMPGAMMETEASHFPNPQMMEDAKHQMAPPDMPGQMSGRSNQFPPPPPGASLGGTPRSQGGASYGGGVGSFDPGQSPAASQRSFTSSRMQSTAGPPGALVPMDTSMPLFIRGQPPPSLSQPFSTAPTGPGGMMPSRVDPNAPAPVPGMPGLPPAPPPPPREDDLAFVRRIRLTYQDKVYHEHDKHDLLEDMEDLGRETPGWVFDTMTVMPYLASSTFTLSAVFIILQYGMKFQQFQEEFWTKGTMIGLGVVLGVLDMIRIIMLTIVELRKYENRKRAKSGDFLPRRVRREGDKQTQIAPPPRLWKQAVAAPPMPKGSMAAMPKGPPPAPPRPAFLPKEGSVPYLAAGAAPPSQGGRRPTPPNSIGNLPVGPPAPPGPGFSTASMQASGAFNAPKAPGSIPGMQNFPPGMPPGAGPATPKSVFSASGTRQMPHMGGATPQAGTPTGSARGPPPKMASAAELMSRSPGPSRNASPRTGGPPGPPSPAHSTHSLSSLAQSLNQQVKAGRHAKAPPPPSQTGSTPVSGSAPPPPPTSAAPNYSRPPSRPISANSANSKARGAPPPPPPS
eukprot:TRINITY_DN27106_c0_g1_i1.p1 TRINITY_DN27106_c0_g1~~TRINITY_DN27106_c0_g1_i1.p1  ORF type:complete len:1512 (+),score=333.94 TRINITY_DN27106_c0_g1_i1:1-4536(+)